jgi:hypothetical protein
MRMLTISAFFRSRALGSIGLFVFNANEDSTGEVLAVLSAARPVMSPEPDILPPVCAVSIPKAVPPLVAGAGRAPWTASANRLAIQSLPRLRLRLRRFSWKMATISMVPAITITAMVCPLACWNRLPMNST